MRQNEENGLLYLQFDGLRDNGRIQHAVFTRQGGVSPEPFKSLNLSVSVPDEKTHVYANRRRAYALLGRDTDTVVHAHLVHGNAVARVTQTNNGTWIRHVDGLITNEPNCALTMNYADCTPIFLYDPVEHAIGLGHAGWQGTVKDVPGALVRAMQTEFNSDPTRLWAGVGPCIGSCCYEVDEPVVSQVRAAFENPEALLLYTNGLESRPHFDLPTANRNNLLRAGVTQIEMSGYCTACRTDLFFSHRAEKGRTGRFGTLLVLG